MQFLIWALALAWTTESLAYRWNSTNDPSRLDPTDRYEYRADQLPLSGELSTPPWSETYWATYLGSINYRWNAQNPAGFGYRPPSRERVLKMSLDELRQLAPSEKYDLYQGRYDYPLYWEARSHSNPRAKDWSGICDGWSIAALQYPEPDAVTMINPDGIAIPFGSSDIKGLMSYVAAFHFRSEPRQVGLNCGYWPFSSGCGDINAGSLHVIFTNQIGIQKNGFVTEISLNREIWNQPTFRYSYEIRGSAQSDATANGLLIHAKLDYTDELDQSQWDPVVGTDAFRFGTLELDYVLDVDESGKIVGGTWISGNDRPDFVWLPTQKLEFTGYYNGIKLMLKNTNLELAAD